MRAALLLLIAVGALGQSIIGVRAGLVTYVEGSAVLDSQRKSHGRYWQVLDGETLRTSTGLVEMQVSAGAILRLGRNSELHMIRTSLENSEALLREGTALLEVIRNVDDSRFRLRLGGYMIEARKPGVYRLDAARSSVPKLRVYGGEASVELEGSADAAIPPMRVVVKRGQQLELAPELSRTSFSRKVDQDPFHIWCAQRSFRLYRNSAESRRKQDHWQRFTGRKYWNESYALEMP